MRLKDKVALITGAGRGLGRAIAEGYANEGAYLVLNDIIEARLQETKKVLEGKARGLLTVTCDVASSQAVESMVSEAKKHFGRIDILVNCAVIIKYMPLISFTDESWKKILDVGLTGYFYSVRSVAKQMIELGIPGKIINTSSIITKMVVPGSTAYAACKGAINAMTQVWAVELAQHRINVNAISPGTTEGDLMRSISTEANLEQRRRHIPMGRLATYTDTVGSAIFLASSEADWVTGAVLVIDGGQSISGVIVPK